MKPAPVHDAAPPPEIVWRVLGHKNVRDAVGRPRDVWVNVQLEVAGRVFGPWHFGTDACFIGAPPDKSVVSTLACVTGGGGDHVEVREKKPGEYVVVKYSEEEGSENEPASKSDVKTVGMIHAASLSRAAIVSADGGAYSAFDP